MKKRIVLMAYLICQINILIAQPVGNMPNNNTADRASSAWYRGGNTPTGAANANNILGTRWPSDIWIMTNEIVTSRFTHNSALVSFTGDAGDGLRINNTGANAAQGNLDLFTSNGNGQNETHARFGISGIISGQRNRFEVMGTTQMGMFYNVTQGSGIHRFSRLDQETGRIGTNNFWRIGLNPGDPVFGGVDAARRLEVLDATTQFRLTFSTNGAFTDFFTNTNGNLQIQPSGQRVGINASADPTANLDVFGNARIRNVQAATPNSILIGVNANGSSDVNVRRLDFTGSSTQVLLGNGTWGNLPTFTPTLANNGVSRNVLFNGPYQLGDLYNGLPAPLFNTNTPLTTDRQIRLNGNDLIFSGNGNVGIGLVFPVQPTEKIDIDGNGRFRNVPVQGGQSIILGLQNGANANDIELSRLIFPNNPNVALLGDGTFGPISNLSANNGASINLNNVVLGQNLNQIGNPALLLNSREIPMNNNNLYFTQNGRIGLGSLFTALTPAAKLDIRPSLVDQKGFYVENSLNFSTVPIYEMNSILNSTIGTVEMYGQGIYMAGNSLKRSTGLKILNTTQTGSAFGIECDVIVDGTTSNNSGRFGAHGLNGGNTAVSGSASGSLNGNTAGSFRAGNPTVAGQNGLLNVGVNAWSISGTTSIGIMATATGGTTNNYAAHFTGDVYANGNILSTSDINLKENVSSLTNADQLLNQLNPVTFDYKQSGIYERMHMPQNLHYGLIAQEVELILPTLIKDGHFPAEYDSLGNIIAAEINFKTMNYEGLIPILVKGHKEQSAQIDSLQSLNNTLQNQVNDLNNRLTQLENCLSGILPLLCQLSQQAIQNNTPAQQEEVRAQLSVRLANKEAIILDQNVPNPFAEQTVINFSIPATVQKAQIHFYDSNGKIIQSVDVVERGLGSLTVFGADLSTGIYTYTLVADGQIVATKRMMKE